MPKRPNVQLGRVYPFEFDARVHTVVVPFETWKEARERFAEIICKGEVLEGFWHFEVKLMPCEKGMTWQEMVAWTRSVGHIGVLPGQTALEFDRQFPDASLHGCVQFTGSCYYWGDREEIITLFRYKQSKRSELSVDFSAGRGYRYGGYRPLILPVIVAQRKLA